MAFFVVACQQLVNAGRLFCRFIENQCTSNRVWHFIFLLTILRIFFIKNITSTSQLPIGIHTVEFQIGNCSQYVTRLLWCRILSSTYPCNFMKCFFFHYSHDLLNCKFFTWQQFDYQFSLNITPMLATKHRQGKFAFSYVLGSLSI